MLIKIHYFSETLRLQGSRLQQKVHRPQLSAQAREERSRGRVLCQQEAQGRGRQGGRTR